MVWPVVMWVIRECGTACLTQQGEMSCPEVELTLVPWVDQWLPGMLKGALSFQVGGTSAWLHLCKHNNTSGTQLGPIERIVLPAIEALLYSC